MPVSTTRPPFSIPNRVELDALERMLTRSRGARVAFAAVNHAGLRDRLAAEAEARLEAKGLHVVRLDVGAEGGEGTLSAIQQALEADGAAAAAFVFGFEKLFDLHAHEAPKVHQMNMERERLARAAPVPVVFWVPDFVLREMRATAPDFWSIRSGVYRFEGEADDAARTVSDVGEGFDWSLRPAERLERREVLERVVAELSGDDCVPAEDRADALYRLGLAYGYEARHREAAERYEEALAVYRAIGTRVGEANVLLSIGRLALAQGKDGGPELEAAEDLYRSIGLTEWADRARALREGRSRPGGDSHGA